MQTTAPLRLLGLLASVQGYMGYLPDTGELTVQPDVGSAQLELCHKLNVLTSNLQ